MLPRQFVDINAPFEGSDLQHTTLPLEKRHVYHNADAFTDLLFIFSAFSASAAAAVCGTLC